MRKLLILMVQIFLVFGQIDPLKSDRLTSRERKSLIGHLEGLSTNSTVALTEKQKLALEQELAFRKQGFAAFSQETDPGLQKNLRQGSAIRKGQRNFEKEFPRRNSFAKDQETSNPLIQQLSSKFQGSSAKSIGHPEDILNQLSLNEKLNFRNKFNTFSQEQQQYVFQKLTSTSPQNQAVAIQQILTMDSQSLQRAINEKLAEGPPQPLFGQTQFSPLDNARRQKQFPEENFRNFAPQSQKVDYPHSPIRPVDIFSPPRHLNPQAQAPRPFNVRPQDNRIPLPPQEPRLPPQSLLQQQGPFAAPNPGIEEELESFRAEVDRANESAIRKQIEALKQIIAQQNS